MSLALLGFALSSCDEARPTSESATPSGTTHDSSSNSDLSSAASIESSPPGTSTTDSGPSSGSETTAPLPSTPASSPSQDVTLDTAADDTSRSEEDAVTSRTPSFDAGRDGDSSNRDSSNRDSNNDAGTAVPTLPNWPTATPEHCSFEIAGEPSPQIGTVGIVDWSTTLTGLTNVRIEFRLDDPKPGELNLGSGGDISTNEARALMLGLKPNRSYTYHLIASAGATVCVSEDHTLVTPETPDVPLIEQSTNLPAARANGFIVAGAHSDAGGVIIDADGEVVWWFQTGFITVRAHMDWAGRHMWMMALNAATGGAADDGKLVRVSMDGSEPANIDGTDFAHHDFAVAPDGVTTFLMGDGENPADSASFLVERSPEGIYTSLTRIDSDSLLAGSGENHANALRYVAHEDSYTVSDLYLNTVAKFNRQGECTWQMSSACEPTTNCVAESLPGSHGHQLLPNGNLIYIAASDFGEINSPAREYRFNLVNGSLVAEEVWSYTSPEYGTMILGDVQRLPNGNTLLTYSVPGVILEVSPDQAIVRKVDTGHLGYAMFRETLYGPPQ